MSAGHEIREYRLSGPPRLGFPSSLDVHGDGPVVIALAGGHTTGSVIVLVTVPTGQRYAFTGDLTWQLDGIRRRATRPLLPRMLAGSDPAQVAAALSSFSQEHVRIFRQMLFGIIGDSEDRGSCL